jgi:hypothetical protein
MLALMATIVLAFRACGFWLRRLPAGSHAHLVVFGVGASVFAQMAIFMAVSYFGQTTMIWYLTIAMGAFLAESMAVERERDQARASAAAERAHERRRLQVASEGGSVRAGARTVAATQPRV